MSTTIETECIDPAEWTTASEAARLLGVSSQRVFVMADDDGSLDVLRPWPRVTLISRKSIATWMSGQRQLSTRPADAKRWLLKRTQVDDLHALHIDVIRDEMREYIEIARPRWTHKRKDLWALETAYKLFSPTGA